MGKHRAIKLVTAKRRRDYLVSELQYDTTKFFTEQLLEIKMKKSEILMIQPVFLVLSILELSTVLVYNFWYEYVKPKDDEKAKLCYMDTDTAYIKIDDIYKGIAEDDETSLDTSKS